MAFSSNDEEVREKKLVIDINEITVIFVVARRWDGELNTTSHRFGGGGM